MRPLALFATLVSALSIAAVARADIDPNALWTVVHDGCVPDEEQHADRGPFALVNLGPGDRSPADLAAAEANGYAVLTDIVGQTQFLLIPTARITGIESPAILAPDATNYFAAAWDARSFVEQRAGRTLSRDWVSLAINSERGRSQNQLHIHVDCILPDVHQALTRHLAEISAAWTPFPVRLAGHRYTAIAVRGDDLHAVNPFTLLADGLPGARADMGDQTLVVVGAMFADGQPGFVILADHVDAVTGDWASGEELQDHTCALPPDPAAVNSPPSSR